MSKRRFGDHGTSIPAQERVRKSVVVEPRDLKTIFDALENWAETGDFVALRTRAFVYVLADGALRTKAAVWLNAEEVVNETDRISIAREVRQRRCEGNNGRGRQFLLTDRSREAIADYLRAARDQGWLQHPSALEGPLWIATHHRGRQQRMSQRTASHTWKTFFEEQVEVSRVYQLDDLVMTGRRAFLAASRLRTELLSRPSGVSERWAAARYRHLLHGPSSTPREVINELNKQRRRKGQPEVKCIP